MINVSTGNISTNPNYALYLWMLTFKSLYNRICPLWTVIGIGRDYNTDQHTDRSRGLFTAYGEWWEVLFKISGDTWLSLHSLCFLHLTVSNIWSVSLMARTGARVECRSAEIKDWRYISSLHVMKRDNFHFTDATFSSLVKTLNYFTILAFRWQLRKSAATCRST
jgi:hypothetical protein